MLHVHLHFNLLGELIHVPTDVPRVGSQLRRVLDIKKLIEIMREKDERLLYLFYQQHFNHLIHSPADGQSAESKGFLSALLEQSNR